MSPIPNVTPKREDERKRQLWADSALVAMTFVWGSSFVLVKDMVAQVSPMLFLSVRFMLAAVALALVMLIMGRWRGLTLRELRIGSLIGAILWAGFAFQTIGLQYTSATNGGFITGLSVVLVPVIGLFVLRHRPDGWSWAGVVLATIGLALLSLRIDDGVRLNSGDLIVLGCAFAFAFQIVFISRFAPSTDPLRLAFVQITVAGLMNALSALLFEKPVVGLAWEVWAGAAFLGLVATALAIAIQVNAQRFTTAVRAALIFTLEPVFAAIFGIWLQGDRLGPLGWVGAGIILTGMVVAEIGPHLHWRSSKRAVAKQFGKEIPSSDVS